MTTVDGVNWNYDITVYPKNDTGDPTLEKSVREAISSTGKTEEFKDYTIKVIGDAKEAKKDGIITDSFKVDSFQHEGLATAAYEGELTVNGNPISRNNTHYQWISDVTTEASDKLGTVTITCDKANKDIVFSTVPEEITSKQSSVINRIFG